MLAFDVVVAGCGVAGLSAAVTAAQAGQKVAILERTSKEERGGQSRYTEAYLRMKAIDAVSDDFETHLAENLGPYLDPELTNELSGEPAGWSHAPKTLAIPDPNVIASFADSVPETIKWLQTVGVKFDFLPTAFLTKTQPRLLPVGGGAAIVEALAAEAERLGVEFFYNATARSLILDDLGNVLGLLANIKGKGGVKFQGRVVLASGGFEGNPEMLARYLGPRSVYLKPICRGGYLNRGEGIQMALDIGAAPSGEFGSYHAEPIDPRSGMSEPCIFIFPYGVLVNKEGKRFTDEAPGTVDAYYERVTRKIYEQTHGLAYVILDQKVKDIPNYKLAIRTDQPAVEAQTLEELAHKLEIPVETFVKEMEHYNKGCVNAKPSDPLQLDGISTSGINPPKSNWAKPINQGPFIAYPIISANVFTFGGLKVNENGQVLTADGDAINGLYAAGEVVGMYYTNYTGATSVLKGLVFGRLAAQHAATQASVL
jgi:tricarballylate dehydrogenase